MNKLLSLRPLLTATVLMGRVPKAETKSHELHQSSTRGSTWTGYSSQRSFASPNSARKVPDTSAAPEISRSPEFAANPRCVPDIRKAP